MDGQTELQLFVDIYTRLPIDLRFWQETAKFDIFGVLSEPEKCRNLYLSVRLSA